MKVGKVRRVKFIYINSRGNGFEEKIIRIEFRVTSDVNKNKNPLELGFII